MRKVTSILSIVSIIISASFLSFYLVDILTSPDRVFLKSLSSVVEIKASTDDIESFGTAVIFSDTELITNFHVVSFTSDSIVYIHDLIEIRFPNSDIYQEVTVERYDTSLDLVLLIMNDTRGKSVKINKLNYSTGQNVILLGNGNNLGISITTGVISRKEVGITYNNNSNKYIQVDATSTNGVSGGALLDRYGRLIGIITLRLLDNNGTPIYGYVYAVPISSVLEFYNLDNK
ncbi:MAG: serine protease [Acholeplasmatales bacterium]|jgi:serine protease Do|nr:serine protease [Acholeplasmatales bacterium]